MAGEDHNRPHAIIATILDFLRKGELDLLIGIVEDEHIEAKGSPYRLSEDREKYELAKDVSAFANTSGGIILIGFTTSKEPDALIERIDRCRPFKRNFFDEKQYRDVLNQRTVPSLDAVSIEWFGIGKDADDSGVAAIIIAPETAGAWPHIVVRPLLEDGRQRGNLFGYFERGGPHARPTSGESLRSLLRDGRRFSNILEMQGGILERLERIENSLKTTPPKGAQAPPPADGKKREERIEETNLAAGLKGEPTIAFFAAAEAETRFPKLFHGEEAPEVSLLEDPPQIRELGFRISARRPAQIVKGLLRRCASLGHSALDLWADGMLIAVGRGDEDLLSWGYQRGQQGEILIRNFVLTELTINFVNLAVEIFKHAEPPPQAFVFGISVREMTTNGHPCKLGSIPDGGADMASRPRHEAPSARVNSEVSVRIQGKQNGSIAFRLLKGLYNQFGFTDTEVPYVDRNAEPWEITHESLVKGIRPR
jgi:hypothetical protein